jgi:hypothetical protein
LPFGIKASIEFQMPLSKFVPYPKRNGARV